MKFVKIADDIYVNLDLVMQIAWDDKSGEMFLVVADNAAPNLPVQPECEADILVAAGIRGRIQ